MRSSFLLFSVSALLLGIVAACSSGGDGDGDGAASAEQGIASNIHVLTSRNDNARTAASTKEKILTQSNVSAATFGRVWSRPVDGQIYAQPLYVGGINGKNVVYVATEHNSVYAFDGDDTRANASPLWHENFGTPLSSADTGCGLLGPEERRRRPGRRGSERDVDADLQHVPRAGHPWSLQRHRRLSHQCAPWLQVRDQQG